MGNGLGKTRWKHYRRRFAAAGLIFRQAATKRRRRRFLLFAAFRYAQAAPFFPEFRIRILASKTS
jgi:hypothetical protein